MPSLSQREGADRPVGALSACSSFGLYDLASLVYLDHIAQATSANVHVTRPTVQYDTAMLHIYLETSIGTPGRMAHIVSILRLAHTHITTSAHKFSTSRESLLVEFTCRPGRKDVRPRIDRKGRGVLPSPRQRYIPKDTYQLYRRFLPPLTLRRQRWRLQWSGDLSTHFLFEGAAASIARPAPPTQASIAERPVSC
jgi:hypothetical protein